MPILMTLYGIRFGLRIGCFALIMPRFMPLFPPNIAVTPTHLYGEHNRSIIFRHNSNFYRHPMHNPTRDRLERRPKLRQRHMLGRWPHLMHQFLEECFGFFDSNFQFVYVFREQRRQYMSPTHRVRMRQEAQLSLKTGRYPPIATRSYIRPPTRVTLKRA